MTLLSKPVLAQEFYCVNCGRYAAKKGNIRDCSDCQRKKDERVAGDFSFGSPVKKAKAKISVKAIEHKKAMNKMKDDKIMNDILNDNWMGE